MNDHELAERLHVELEDLRAVVNHEITRAVMIAVDTAYADVERRVFLADMDVQRAWTEHRDELRRSGVSVNQLVSYDALRARRELTPLAAQHKPWTADQLDRSHWCESSEPSSNVWPNLRFERHDALLADRRVAA